MDPLSAGSSRAPRAAGPAIAAASALALALGAPVAFAQDPVGVAAGDETSGPERYIAPGSTAEAAPRPRMTARTRAGLAWERVGDHAIVEGDVIIGRVDENGRLDAQLRPRGLGHDRALGRWPDGIVPYEFTDGVDAATRDTVLAAIDHWMTHTRLTFVERTADNAPLYNGWVQFFATGGCASYVGRVDRQPQPVYVQGCTVGSVIHELGHAVGLYHEHTRPDRDMWVAIAPDEIQPGREFNFEIQRTNAQNLGPYDYGSIMHYGERFFARGGEPTIVVPPGEAIGQRVALSAGDIRAVDSMYATDLALGVVTRREGELYELDITVNNLGPLGASGLEMIVTIGDDTRWVGMSQDSGWDCLKDDAELYCRRETLPETAPQSRLKLQAEPGAGASVNDVRARLASRTLDTDTANNVVNEVVPALAAALVDTAAEDGLAFREASEAPPEASGAPEVADASISPMASVAPEGELAATPSQPTPASSSAAGTGAPGPAGLLGLAVALGLTRVRGARDRPGRATAGLSADVAGRRPRR